MTPDVFVVVVSYNNARFTKEAAASLLGQEERVQFVVWDNASPDGAGEQLEDWFTRLRPEHGILHRSPENLMWSPAINQAIERYATDETVIGFMNNDLTLPPAGVATMLEVVRRPEVGLVGPTASAIGGPQDFAAHHGHVPNARAYCADHLKPKRTTYLIGACCLLRREVWDEIGPLDEAMPLGADDHDYSIRVKQKGYQIWIDERVYADHRGHASGDSPNWDEWGGRSWARFNEKWADYYLSEEEAIKSHWGGVHHDGYDR